MYYTQFDTGVCPIILMGDDKGICRLHMVVEGDRRSMDLIADLECKDDFFNKAKEQILDFLEGKRRDFDLKLNLVGTDFQKKVWKALLEIPYGETRTYKDIATVIGNSNASRAVGMANNKNPLPLIIPCHRVVGSKGQLTGYAFGLEIKDRLLAIENLL